MNHELYLHTVFEFLVIYRGLFSSCEIGSNRTCCTNGLGMYTPPRASPAISVKKKIVIITITLIGTVLTESFNVCFNGVKHLMGNWTCNIQRTASDYFFPDPDFHCYYPCGIFLSHIPILALGKVKTGTVALWLYVDPWCHCNVKITSPCRISAYYGFPGRLYQVFFRYN